MSQIRALWWLFCEEHSKLSIINTAVTWVENPVLREVKYLHHDSLIVGAEYESQNCSYDSNQNVFIQVAKKKITLVLILLWDFLGLYIVLFPKDYSKLWYYPLSIYWRPIVNQVLVPRSTKVIKHHPSCSRGLQASLKTDIII